MLKGKSSIEVKLSSWRACLVHSGSRSWIFFLVLVIFAVSRLVATSESHGMHLALDFNTELYPLTVGARFTFALASSLSRVVDTEESDVRNVWRPDNKGRVGIEKDYDYVMYGKVRYLLNFCRD